MVGLLLVPWPLQEGIVEEVYTEQERWQEVTEILRRDSATTENIRDLCAARSNLLLDFLREVYELDCPVP